LLITIFQNLKTGLNIKTKAAKTFIFFQAEDVSNRNNITRCPLSEKMF